MQLIWKKADNPLIFFIYNFFCKELKILQKYLNSLQKKEWIWHNKLPAGTSIFFAPKQNGIIKLYVYYYGFNKMTIKNHYSLPLVSKMLDQLFKAKFFTKLDLQNAYYRLYIKKGDK